MDVVVPDSDARQRLEPIAVGVPSWWRDTRQGRRPVLPQVLHRRSRASASRTRSALAAGASEQRSAAEQLDQLGSLPAAEAGDRLCVGDPAVGKGPIGLRRSDPGYGQQQLACLRRLRACRRLAEHLRQRDPASGEVSLQLRPCQANLVRSCERPQPLLRRACPDCRLAALDQHCAAILRVPEASGAARTRARATRPAAAAPER